jgi:hypothetical protein
VGGDGDVGGEEDVGGEKGKRDGDETPRDSCHVYVCEREPGSAFSVWLPSFFRLFFPCFIIT